MRAIVCGANGAMGKLISQRLGEHQVGAVSIDGENGASKTFQELGDRQADVIIDFSHHSAVSEILDYAERFGCAVVIGTTGHTEEEKRRIYAAGDRIPVFYSGNMSLGIAVLCRLAKQAAAAFPEADIEILEIHHNRKVDAPSGTAHMLFQAVQQVRPQATEHCGRTGEGKRTREEIGISSLRLAGIVGIHEIHICTPTQQLVLRHEAFDRGMFADGALEAAAFLAGKQPGIYNMENLLG